MKSVQILFKKSGVVVEKWIIGGGTKVGSAVLQKTKQPENINCEVHENMLDIEFTSEGIFCKICGVKLKLIPEWIVGSKDSDGLS